MGSCPTLNFMKKMTNKSRQETQAVETRGRSLRVRGRVRSLFPAIKRSAWFNCNPSLGSPLSHFTTTATPSYTTTLEFRVCSSLGIQD
ncbi:hypothetical protein HanIR_Chr01g0039761 [Helianthus annuus]|nr:hypothetical protein HanIR_Chr01g0039761 [Helianthus annuus]